MAGWLTRRRRGLLIVLALVMLALAVRVDAQFRRSFFRLRYATPQDFDGGFNFCRVHFRSDFRGDADGDWSVDWPRADINLSIRLAELTKTRVSFAPSGEPNYLLVRLTDDVLFNCPFIMMTEVGSAYISDEEAARLREYLLKGGFLWADDFWGSYAWEWWVGQFSRVLPPSEYPIVDLEPTHPLFRSQFVVEKVPQISSINFWARSGGGTSERFEDSAVAHARAVLDRHGNIMVLMTHNTDIGDSFEREADDPQYFYTMSVPGYAFGVNTLLYALTH
ncbi:MAG TPA: DUF4159 domain-containing protein [Vicinamibacterales bacterium]|nr:DUF4159 domain-containing protein [Vicinamibacterales bacterium]